MACIFQNLCQQKDICITNYSFESETPLERNQDPGIGATGSRFWLITQSLPRTLQQKLDSKSTLPHIIPSPERPGLPCWGFWVLFVWIRDPGGSVQLCLFANRRQFPTRKAIWIRTACLAAAQRFSLKPAGSRWINRTQRYRLNPCKLLTLG